MANKIADQDLFNYFKITKELFTLRPMNLSRRNYWLYFTLNTAIYTVLIFIVSLFIATLTYYAPSPLLVINCTVLFAASIYFVLVDILSTMARLHNAGLSAAWTWLYLVPLGNIPLIIMRCPGPADSKYTRKQK